MEDKSIQWFRWQYENNPTWLGEQSQALFKHYIQLMEASTDYSRGHFSDCDHLTKGTECTCGYARLMSLLDAYMEETVENYGKRNTEHSG